ncbi:MAG: hypothetical protein ACWA44_02070 [Thiotrichales bacterium]
MDNQQVPRNSLSTQSLQRKLLPFKAALLFPALMLVTSFSPLSAAELEEVDALRALIESTKIDGVSPLIGEGWNTGDPCNDSWGGVVCDSGGNITQLKLGNLDLYGTLPAELSALSHLTSLRLSGNHLAGAIPDSLGDLATLKTLLLDNNAFSGPVPASLKNLTMLEALDLRYNRLEPSNDPDTNSFLDAAQIEDNDWSATQTVIPADFQATARTIDSISLAWTPIEYIDDGGAYEIFVSKDNEFSDEELLAETEDKSASDITISNLDASRRYYFAIRTRTDSPGGSRTSLLTDLSDTVSEYTLRDTDGDSIADINDPDADNDGLSNEEETTTTDTDADGLPDYVEHNFVDTDADGIYDVMDDDDDGDGLKTAAELGETVENPQDSDVDGLPDYLDVDSNNTANTADGSGDSDQDGISDAAECPVTPNCVDTDGDLIANYMDKDDDNDGLLTRDESTTSDADGDGLIDALEPNSVDTDGDGLRNHNDPDDDNDGTPTATELSGKTLYAPDIDGDGIPDYLDLDSFNTAGVSDGSGDSDGDGISDSEECPAAPSCPDINKDGIPSYNDSAERTLYEKIDPAVLGDAGMADPTADTGKSGGGSLGLLLTLLAGATRMRRRNVK